MFSSESTIIELIEDAYSFCCSFHDYKAPAETTQSADVEMSEVSAFDDEAMEDIIEISTKKQLELE
jgi:hypothetical protein